uniref:Uncharacterized protein n=1 Tax=Anopheles minimus TaxID=112268 RepID=A0A182WN92_9DIPT
MIFALETDRKRTSRRS